MLNSAKLVVVIPVRDSQQARPFYEDVLGLRFVTNDSFAAIMESNGATVRLAQTPKFTPAEFTVMGWEVTGIEQTMAALEKKGVRFERYPGMNQDAQGVWTAPNGAKVAWFKDPDGNILSVSQHV